MIKNKKILLFLFLFISYHFLFSQCYWQQQVDYKMDIFLDVNTNILKGQQKITYYNNSPDTLKEIYFHLYWNAFKKGSYMYKKSISVKRITAELIDKLTKEEEGNVIIKKISIKNKQLNWEEHDTILRLILDEPLNPKDSVVIETEFESQVPLLVRRAGRDNSQDIRYSMAQWYPKIAEYDLEGWHHDEYAGREFYGVWGNFDVKITLDSRYIVASSGVIQNPEEVKCGYELGKIDTTIIEYEHNNFTNKVKTWHFKAENVHDFAWAADFKYIHDITYWNNVIIHSLYTPAFRDRWKNVKYYAQQMLDFYSQNYGPYPYKSFTVVQAGDGGMEYPTIIFNLGYSPGLMAHEGGHQWFYGLLGNNETREAWLDEGFITYTTDKNTIEKFNYPIKIEPEKGLKGLFQLPYDQNNNYRYYWSISKLNLEEPILTHSDIFKDDMAYSFSTYVKGSFVLPMLEYVIGDDKFKLLMKEYYNKWHFKHPHSNDFQRLAEKISGMELDWFFDEWLRTTKKCDYAITSFSGNWIEIDKQRKYNVKCNLENRDEIVMPLDLTINFVDGTSQKAIIPVDWNPKKEINSILLPRWDWVDKNYSFEYNFEKQVTSIEIDPSLRMKDLNRLNNKSGLIPPLDINFIRPIQLSPPIDKYWITYRPNLWYSIKDGLRIGLFEQGGYMGYQTIQPDYNNNFGINYLTKSKQVDFEFMYSLPIKSFGTLTYLNTSAYKLYGIKGFDFRIEHTITPLYPLLGNTHKVCAYYNFNQLVENDLPFYNIIWDRGSLNKFGIYYQWLNYNKDKTKFTFNLESIFHKDSRIYKFSLEFLYSLSNIPLSFRFFGGYSSSMPPYQERFYLSYANPNEQYSDKVYKSILFLNQKFNENAKINLSGGGGITSLINHNINGKNMISLNFNFLEYKLSDLNINLPLLKETQFNSFINLSNIWNNSYKNLNDFYKNIYTEAGVTFSIQPFNNLGIYSYIIPEIKDLSLNFNIPFYMSKNEYNNKIFDWRWNISIGKLINI